MFAEPRVVADPSDCWFYHVIDGVPATADAPWDLRGKFSEYIGDVDLCGKRVLDVGSASGFLSFSAESAGAAEVVSFDMDSSARMHLLPFHEHLYYRDHRTWVEKHNEFTESLKNGYWFAHRALGSRAKVYYGDIYDLPEELGSFDVAIVAAVFEHLGSRSCLDCEARPLDACDQRPPAHDGAPDGRPYWPCPASPGGACFLGVLLGVVSARPRHAWLQYRTRDDRYVQLSRRRGLCSAPCDRGGARSRRLCP